MNWTNRLSQLALVAMLFALASCAPVVNPSPYPNISTASPTPRTIPTFPKYPTPIPPTPILISPTPIQLPVIEGNVEREYCDKPHPVYLPVSEAQGLTDDDITEKLMSLYLDYFNNPQAPDYCRIDGYRIERVFYDESMTSRLATRRGDFMRGVDYSIKLIQLPNYWMGAYGEIDQQNWFHISDELAIYRVKSDSVYTMHREVGGG